MCLNSYFAIALRYAFGMLLLIGIATGCRDFDLPPSNIDEIEWVATESNIELARLAITSNGTLVGIVDENPRRVVRSRNRGATWEQVLTTPAEWETLSGHIATGPDGRVYVIMLGEADAKGNRTIGVYRSTDHGLNWRELDATLLAAGVNALAVSGRGTVFLGTTGLGSQGLYRSENGGETWEPTMLTAGPLSEGRIHPQSLAFGRGGLVLAAFFTLEANRAGLYRSEGDGENWLRLGNPPFVPGSLAIARTGTTFGIGRVLNEPAFSQTLFLSPDEGSSWFPTSLILEQNAVPTITTTPREQVFVAAGFSGIFRSVDDGETWEPMNEGLPISPLGLLQVNVSQVLIAPDGYLYANTNSGLYRSAARVE